MEYDYRRTMRFHVRDSQPANVHLIAIATMIHVLFH